MAYIHIPQMAPGMQFEFELLQAREEGRDLTSLQPQIDAWSALTDERERQAAAIELMTAIQAQPLRTDYPYQEPSAYQEILAARPSQNGVPAGHSMSTEALYSKLYGAWLGRCAGCMLGQPLEGWRRARIDEFLKAQDNFPVKDYCRSDISPELYQKFELHDEPGPYGLAKVAWRNNITYVPQDDDTNYTIFSVLALEQHGRAITPYQVLELWLDKFPLGMLWTAERTAYRNAVLCIEPPESATYCNPYREWIGAQIRTDGYGYVSPGNPVEAARLAFVDASISHVKNGIYGAMWVAAMLAQAAVDDDIESVINAGLAQVPANSRFTEALREVITWHHDGLSGEQALDNIHKRYDEYNQHEWCHTISNAMIVAIALLWGEKDFSKTMHYALIAAFDTDCNCATAGSVLGMILGADALPKHWTAITNNKVATCLNPGGLMDISDLAQRCVELAQQG